MPPPRNIRMELNGISSKKMKRNCCQGPRGEETENISTKRNLPNFWNTCLAVQEMIRLPIFQVIEILNYEY